MKKSAHNLLLRESFIQKKPPQTNPQLPTPKIKQSKAKNPTPTNQPNIKPKPTMQMQQLVPVRNLECLSSN